LLCRLAGVSRSGYYAFKKACPERFKKDAQALAIIKKYFIKSFEKAGIVTLDMLMRKDGFIINHKKIARIKREYGLITKIRRRNPYREIPLKSREHKIIPNILRRDFNSLQPDEIYSTDMTYLFYGKCEKAYLSATKDLATNEIVSFNLMRTPTVSAFTQEFKKLIEKLPGHKKANLIIHSDQGFQYTHPDFIKLLHEHGVTQSMSRAGNCLDNAPIESFFGHFKDLIDLKSCRTIEDVEKEIKRKINYYNTERPQKALNKKPPAEYRGLLSSFF
jgi:transposase InsO family protein